MCVSPTFIQSKNLVPQQLKMLPLSFSCSICEGSFVRSVIYYSCNLHQSCNVAVIFAQADTLNCHAGTVGAKHKIHVFRCQVTKPLPSPVGINNIQHKTIYTWQHFSDERLMKRNDFHFLSRRM